MKHDLSHKTFKGQIWDHYAKHRRCFPWRDELSPYRVLVSEVMLQQTQTDRVLSKFEPFIARFPDFLALAEAPFQDVLKLWKGLGYNRRALNVQKSAQIILETYQGHLPIDPLALLALPGIGKATACSVVAFAFNKPTIFIETNIRTVFIHAFFNDRHDIHDREILPLVTKTVDKERPREWYYALMDYGVMLKRTVGNLSKRSVHYQVQSRFLGSDRQIRGQILELLLEHQKISEMQMLELINNVEAERMKRIMRDLCAEGLIKKNHGALEIG